MNIATMTVERKEAVRKFREYRDALHTKHNRDDAILMECYRALKNGKRLIHIGEVIRAGGQHENGLPKFAICHAAGIRVRLESGHLAGNSISFVPRDSYSRRRKSRSRIVISGLARPIPDSPWNYEAAVPQIPPRFRPEGELSNYHLLWEADWERPTVDPVLLKEVKFPYFAVLAMWDLTPLESSVLGLPLNVAEGIA